MRKQRFGPTCLCVLAFALSVPVLGAMASDDPAAALRSTASSTPAATARRSSERMLGLAGAESLLDPASDRSPVEATRLEVGEGRFLFQPTESKPVGAAQPPAAAGADDSAELAKKLSNPVADLISVPFQLNYDTGFGVNDAARYQLNIQPVIPFSISEEWNLITRTILPVIYAESPAAGIDDKFGLGDTTQSFFFSPKKGDVIWGVGPAFLWPTATSTQLGTGQWGIGPTVVVLQQKSGWTYGMLANHIWSYAGPSDRADVNSTFLQPFLAYTTPTYTTFTLNTESTYDWSGQQWTVPINVMAAQLLKISGQPVQFQIGGRYYADKPSGGPEWGLRFAITFLFPK